MYSTNIFGYNNEHYLALTPSRIVLVSNLYNPAANNYDIEPIGLILPNFEYLCVKVSEDENYIAFLAKRNSLDLLSNPEYKIVVYKKGNQFAHFVLSVTLRDSSVVSFSYSGLFSITKSNKLVLSSILKSSSGVSIF